MKCDLTLINLENREKKNIQWCISKTQLTKQNKTKQNRKAVWDFGRLYAWQKALKQMLKKKGIKENEYAKYRFKSLFDCLPHSVFFLPNPKSHFD